MPTSTPSADPYAEACGFAQPVATSVTQAAAGWTLDASTAHLLRSSPGRGLAVGQIVTHDFRTPQMKAAAAATSSESPRPLRIIQWNVERGYKLAEIIALLRSQDADIIALQEIDVGCARTGWKDTGREIAEALQMNYAFVCEFQELYSLLLRNTAVQGGGVHGNAVLSRFDHGIPQAVRHADSFPWMTRGHEKGEPRVGQRFTLATPVHVRGSPQQTSKNGSSILVYSAHLEVFAGIEARLRSFGEIQAHAATAVAAMDGTPHIAVLGDFNTLAHGIARCSPAYSNDRLRFGSLGWTEAEWWVRHVLTDAQANPLGFYCPFDAYADSTLTNYRGWFQGKLDWMLLSHLSHTEAWLGNEDYHASDHKLLGCTVTMDEPIIDDSDTHGDASNPPRFRQKSSERLRELMPLTRARPGIVTSCARRPHVYGAQIALFWCVIVAAGAWIAGRVVAVAL